MSSLRENWFGSVARVLDTLFLGKTIFLIIFCGTELTTYLESVIFSFPGNHNNPSGTNTNRIITFYLRHALHIVFGPVSAASVSLEVLPPRRVLETEAEL